MVLCCLFWGLWVGLGGYLGCCGCSCWGLGQCRVCVRFCGVLGWGCVVQLIGVMCWVVGVVVWMSMRSVIVVFFFLQLCVQMCDLVWGMFVFGYDNYMVYVFFQDEFNFIYCCGCGFDCGDFLNLNINDVLGNYLLIFVDVLDIFVIMGNLFEFQKVVKLVINIVLFDKDFIV